VFILRASCFCNTSRTWSSTISRIFEKLSRFNVSGIYYSSSQYITFKNHISCHLSVYPTSACTNRPRTESFKLSSRAICATSDCLLVCLIDNCRRLIWLRLSNDSNIVLRNKFFYHIQLARQITFHLFQIIFLHNIKSLSLKKFTLKNIIQSILIRVYILCCANWAHIIRHYLKQWISTIWTIWTIDKYICRTFEWRKDVKIDHLSYDA